MLTLFWPTEPHPVSLQELGWINTAYLASTRSRGDPTIVWGTSISTDGLNRFISEQRTASKTLVSTAHVLIRAVIEALYRHPAANRRVIGSRVYPHDGIHITMPTLETRSGEVSVIYLQHAERLTLAEISRAILLKARDAAAKAAENRDPSIDSRRQRLVRWRRLLWLHWVHLMARLGFLIFNVIRLPAPLLKEMIGGGTFVNHLGFPGAPPMISYKPSSLPTNSFGVSVTLGPAELKPVVQENKVVIRSVAPLFVRVDHRLVNGYQTAAFICTLRDLLQDPQGLVDSAINTNAPAV
jgi:hypothetical protein